MGRSLAFGSHDYVRTLYGEQQSVCAGRFADCQYRLTGPGKTYDICESTDCPYFASVWSPNADYEALRFAAQLITFLYLWDDGEYHGSPGD
ncbi:hypothetical protein DL767_009747 [Monosporascus sp. MG133]|nr:hypothetical protein DL767_009747 [Monosporascus sp. MG133]